MPRNRQFPPSTIKTIFERDSATCVYCGAPAMEIDHVIPHKWGGKAIRKNGVCACRYCNLKKRNHIEDDPYWLTRGIFHLLQHGEDTSWMDKFFKG